ncbi:MAG: hypothetical protein ACYDH6_13125 [Acidimicrobiales bacterium]
MDEPRRAARLPLPSSVPCDQCSGSMHRRERLFVCDRCGKALTVSTVARLLPKPDLTEG